MRDGGSVEPVSAPEALATTSTTGQDSDQTPHQRYSRELKGITDRRHFEDHPRHDSVFTHGSATASRSTSVAPSTARKTARSIRSGVGTDLEMAPGAPSGDEEPTHGRGPRLGSSIGDRMAAHHRATTVRGKGKAKTLQHTNPEERLARGTRDKVADATEDDWDKQETTESRSGRCTRSQLGRTAPPEIADTKELCEQCEIRARTSGARDCARYVCSSSFVQDPTDSRQMSSTCANIWTPVVKAV